MSIPAYTGAVPNRSMTPAEFQEAANDYLAYQLGPFTTGINSTETNINAKELSATSAEAAAELARDVAIDAKDDAVTAQGLAEDARDDAVTAQGLAEDARDDAVTAQGLAQNYAAALTGTSATSITPAVSSFAGVTQGGKQFLNAVVNFVSSGAPTARMWGVITAYNSSTGAYTFVASSATGSGAHTDWQITVAGDRGATGATFGQTVVDVTGTSVTASAGTIYALKNAAATTLTLPASPADNDLVGWDPCNGRLDNVIARNGNNIVGVAQDLTWDLLNVPGSLRFKTGLGWRFA